jgi:hypothetical protein
MSELPPSKFLTIEYLLQTLYEDYPVLGDYEEDILDDKATLILGTDDSPDADLVATYISEEDYRRLTPAERNQWRRLQRFSLRLEHPTHSLEPRTKANQEEAEDLFD